MIGLTTFSGYKAVLMNPIPLIIDESISPKQIAYAMRIQRVSSK